MAGSGTENGHPLFREEGRQALLPFTVELDNFSGPLDLLLSLVRKQELELESLDLSAVTDQYLRYVTELDLESLDDGYYFLVVASTLLELKLRRLYAEDGEEEPEEARRLRRSLKNYALLEEAVGLMDRMRGEEAELRTRGRAADYPDKKEHEELKPVTLPDLMEAFKAALERRKRQREEDQPLALSRDRRPIEQAVEEVTERLRKRGRMTLRQFIESAASLSALITDFLALLQLVNRENIALRDTAEGIELSFSENSAEGDETGGDASPGLDSNTPV